MLSPTGTENREGFNEGTQITGEHNPTEPSQGTPTEQGTRNSEVHSTPETTLPLPTEPNALPFPANMEYNTFGAFLGNSNQQTQNYEAEGSLPDVHVPPIGALSVGDTTTAGEAFVPEGTREVIVGMDSPPTSPPPPQYDTLPVIITEQPRVIMMAANGVPCNVIVPPGDPPPTYEEVLGLPVPENQNQMEGALRGQEENKGNGSRLMGCIVFLSLIIPCVLVIVITNTAF